MEVLAYFQIRSAQRQYRSYLEESELHLHSSSLWYLPFDYYSCLPVSYFPLKVITRACHSPILFVPFVAKPRLAPAFDFELANCVSKHQHRHMVQPLKSPPLHQLFSSGYLLPSLPFAFPLILRFLSLCNTQPSPKQLRLVCTDPANASFMESLRSTPLLSFYTLFLLNLS